jgi:hypothetical protein
MSFLLKIVQGPNAGAEIALVEGMSLSFGRADDCDIILSDSSVADKAFELEVSSERVTAIMPGGKSVKLEPYHVAAIGTSAVVVGPQEGEWKPLVWPRPDTAEEEPAGDGAEAEAEVEAPPPAKRRSCGCAVFVLILAALAGAAIFGCRKYPEKAKECFGKVRECATKAWVCASEKIKSVRAPAAVAAPKESLDAVAADCGFAVSRSGGRTLAKGDFKTRVARLEATARAYAAQPGVEVDFTDTESLSNAVSELLALVSEGKLKLERLEGRKVFLAGHIASRSALESVLRALGEDVPKVAGADCSLVKVGGVDLSSGGGSAGKDGADAPKYDVPRMKNSRLGAASVAKNPEMPVAGILTVPYPCLVLSDGTRAMEGACFGGFVIEKIEADRVRVRQADGTFEWRP